MTRKVTAVVLCEDKQARAVLYRYLARERGFPRVRVLPLPAGDGCGSQYVRESYAREVAAQRDKAVSTVLVVHIDADNHTVADRHRALAEELSKVGMEPRGADEPIALVVPRWETETWIHHDQGRVVAEADRDLPKLKGREAEAASPAVKALVALVDKRTVAPANIPAIAVAATELQRLP